MGNKNIWIAIAAALGVTLLVIVVLILNNRPAEDEPRDRPGIWTGTPKTEAKGLSIPSARSKTPPAVGNPVPGAEQPLTTQPVARINREEQLKKLQERQNQIGQQLMAAIDAAQQKSGDVVFTGLEVSRQGSIWHIQLVATDAWKTRSKDSRLQDAKAAWTMLTDLVKEGASMAIRDTAGNTLGGQDPSKGVWVTD